MSRVKRKYRGEIFRCRVHPDGKSRYYLVLLFDTLTAMRKMFCSLGYSWNHVKRSLGACECSTSRLYRGRKAVRISPLLGMVLLTKGYEGAWIVTHEFTHAAIGFMRRSRRDLADLNSCVTAHGYAVSGDVEESLADATGAMVSQFYCKLERKHKELWKR